MLVGTWAGLTALWLTAALLLCLSPVFLLLSLHPLLRRPAAGQLRPGQPSLLQGELVAGLKQWVMRAHEQRLAPFGVLSHSPEAPPSLLPLIFGAPLHLLAAPPDSAVLDSHCRTPHIVHLPSRNCHQFHSKMLLRFHSLCCPCITVRRARTR